MEPGDLTLLFDALTRYEQQAIHDALSAVDSRHERSAQLRSDRIIERINRVRAWLSDTVAHDVLAANRLTVRAS